MKKQPFLLLEVLIALSLVLLCAIPLILQPIKTYRSELLSLEQMEGERLANWTFSEIKESMLKNQISWDQLPGLRATTGPFPLDHGFIQVSGREPKKIARSFTLYGQGEKKGLGGETYRMIYVKIEFDPPLSEKKKIRQYRLAVQKIPKDAKM